MPPFTLIQAFGAIPPEWVATGLAACRVGGMVLTWPTVGAGVLPWRTRIAIAGVVGLAVASTCPAPKELSLSGALVFGELLAGVLLGLGLRVVLTALRAAGTWIDEQVGTGLTAEPLLDESSDENLQGTAQLLVWMGTWLILTMPLGAQGVWLDSLRESFRALPIGAVSTSEQRLALGVAWLRSGSVLALGIALPICLLQGLLYGGLAMLSRSWGISLGQAISPLRAVVALVLLWLLIPYQAERLEAELARMTPAESAHRAGEGP